jgi:hypothetical protein
MKERSYLMDELGDPDAPIGSKLWCLYVSNEIRKTYYDKTQLGARLKNLVETFTEHQGWQELGFLTWEKFCESRLQIAAEKLETEARNRVVEIAENAKPLAEQEYGNGKAGPGRGNKTDYNCNPFLGEGNNADYLTARIARDNPAILEDMKQGKYRSVRAAAIDAGIIDPDKARRYQLPTDPAAAGRYLAGRVDAEWMLECYDAFMKTGDSPS